MLEIGEQIQNGWEKTKGTVEQILQKSGATIRSLFGLYDLSHSTITNNNVKIPANATLLRFDFMFANKGDGDWLTVHFNDLLLWSFRGGAFPGTVPIQSTLPIADLAGQTGRLTFRLHGMQRDARRI